MASVEWVTTQVRWSQSRGGLVKSDEEEEELGAYLEGLRRVMDDFVSVDMVMVLFFSSSDDMTVCVYIYMYVLFRSYNRRLYFFSAIRLYLK